MDIIEYSVKDIRRKIYFLRGHKVMLDSDLAYMYGVTTKRLNEQVRRNKSRFPNDFMFQLNEEEFEVVKAHTKANAGRGGKRKLPLVFTEQGVAMLSSVLASERAAQVNVAIMRTFVKLREVIAENKELAEKIEKLESKFEGQFQVVFDVLDQLLATGLPVTQKKIKTLAEK